MTAKLALAPVPYRKSRILGTGKRVVKRVGFVAAAVYFAPATFAVYVVFGLLDFVRNKARNLASLDRYFAGNGVFTWLLAPFNLLMDLLALPYCNKGIYQLADLPKPYQDEITDLIEAAQRSDLVGKLNDKLTGVKRGMIFFKWYGKNVATSLDVPELQRPYKYIPQPRRLHQGGHAHQLLAREQAVHLRRHAAAQVVQRIG
jgi:beta-hydroxylase